MNDSSKIKIYSNVPNHTLLRLQCLNIYCWNINFTKDGIILNLNSKDINKIKKYYKIKILELNFSSRVKLFLKKNYINIFIFSLAFLLYIFFSNLIIDVKIISNNEEIRKIISDSLEKHHISHLSLKKDYEYLSKVKEDILTKYKDKIEWLEIEPHGLTYVVKVTEKIMRDDEESTPYCHIIAAKEGIITKITNSQGEVLKSENSHVNKGDIIISGIIKAGEEDKGYTCAQGKVYAEVWYTVSVSIPLYEEEKIYTGKTRYNLKYTNGNTDYTIFKSRLKYHDDQDYKLISLLSHDLSLVKEKEYIIKENKLSEEEALVKANLLISEKINLKLTEEEKILYKKVLKKNVNDSTIDIEAFVVAEEIIGEEITYTIPLERVE